MDAFASLIFWPAAGRCAAGKAPRLFSCSVSKPFLPSRRTRTSSRPCKSADAFTSARACSTRLYSDSAVAIDESRESRRVSGYGRPNTPRNPKRSGRFAGRRSREAGLGLLCDRRKGRHVMHRKVGKHLAIDCQFRLVQAVYQRAVGHPAQARRRVDARDPQGAELTLFLATTAVSVLACLDDGLLGRTEYFAPGIEIAL